MPLSVDETFLFVSCQIGLTPVMAGHYSACGYITKQSGVVVVANSIRVVCGNRREVG